MAVVPEGFTGYTLRPGYLLYTSGGCRAPMKRPPAAPSPLSRIQILPLLNLHLHQSILVKYIRLCFLFRGSIQSLIFNIGHSRGAFHSFTTRNQRDPLVHKRVTEYTALVETANCPVSPYTHFHCVILDQLSSLISIKSLHQPPTRPLRQIPC